MKVWLNLLNFFSLLTQFEFEEQVHTLRDGANRITLGSSGSHRLGLSLLYSKIQTGVKINLSSDTTHHQMNLQGLFRSAVSPYFYP